MECEVESTRRRTAIHAKTWIAKHDTYAIVVLEKAEGSWKRGSAKARQSSRRLPSASAVEATDVDVEARTSTSVPRSTPWNVCKVLHDVVDTPFASCGWKGAQAREVLFHTRRLANRMWMQRIRIASACLLQDRGRPHAFPRSSCIVPSPPGILRRDARARMSRGCVAHGRRHGRSGCN